MRQVATPGLGGQQLQGAVQLIGGKRGMKNNLYSAHGHKEAKMSRQQSAVMQQTAETTVRTALQVPRPKDQSLFSLVMIIKIILLCRTMQ